MQSRRAVCHESRALFGSHWPACLQKPNSVQGGIVTPSPSPCQVLPFPAFSAGRGDHATWLWLTWHRRKAAGFSGVLCWWKECHSRNRTKPNPFTSTYIFSSPPAFMVIMMHGTAVAMLEPWGDWHWGRKMKMLRIQRTWFPDDVTVLLSEL